MKTVGDSLEEFEVTGIKPGATGADGISKITEVDFAGKWKIIVFYPKDFTFVCPTEIIAYDKLNPEFEKRDAVLMIGSTDNEFCKLAWKNSHAGLKATNCWFFADTSRDSWRGLSNNLGVFDHNANAALRATFIVDPKNVIQHVTVNNLDVGRNPDEALRVLDALQTGELCACNRAVGGETLVV